ncbi:MAG: putative glycosyltransferase [Chlamydiae bacterium]|nr:putative glycosyltransferase [Chlamydiota bacterium]
MLISVNQNKNPKDVDVMLISIVTTLYNSEKYIETFYNRCILAIKSINCNYEIIFVDDGSVDNSILEAKKLVAADNKVTLVELSKNFGHHKAMLKGITYAKGEYAFIIDSDLEEDPALLKPFFNKLHLENCDVVYGVQNKRKGAIFEKLTGGTFWDFFNKVASTEVPKNGSTVRLMNKKYYNALSKYVEKVVFMHGIWADVGFKQVPHKFDKLDKKSTGYSFLRKARLAVDSITSFSSAPLKGIFYTGVFITLISLSIALYVCIKKIFFGFPVSGWASIVMSIWVVGGLTFAFLGLIGIYISRIFIEVKQRPTTIVSNIYKKEPQGSVERDVVDV